MCRKLTLMCFWHFLRVDGGLRAHRVPVRALAPFLHLFQPVQTFVRLSQAVLAVDHRHFHLRAGFGLESTGASSEQRQNLHSEATFGAVSKNGTPALIICALTVHMCSTRKTHCFPRKTHLRSSRRSPLPARCPSAPSRRPCPDPWRQTKRSRIAETSSRTEPAAAGRCPLPAPVTLQLGRQSEKETAKEM